MLKQLEDKRAKEGLGGGSGGAKPEGEAKTSANNLWLPQSQDAPSQTRGTGDPWLGSAPPAPEVLTPPRPPLVPAARKDK